MGGLTAGREGGRHDIIAYISLHTVWLRAQGSVPQSISMGSLSNYKRKCGCAWCCVQTCTFVQSSKCSWLTACQLLFNTSRLTCSPRPPPCSRLEKGKNKGRKMERWWSGGLEWERWRKEGGREGEWREWGGEQRWAWGFMEVMICLVACAHPPPQWHNRTMYSKGFKYLYSDLMFLHTHTHTQVRARMQIQLKAWKEQKWNSLTSITIDFFPVFHPFPCVHFSFTPWVVSAVV